MGVVKIYTQAKALNLIEKRVGFPNPSPKYLEWYFRKISNDEYVPRVDFDALAEEIACLGMVEKLRKARLTRRGSCLYSAVIIEIHSTIKRHELETVEVVA